MRICLFIFLTVLLQFGGATNAKMTPKEQHMNNGETVHPADLKPDTDPALVLKKLGRPLELSESDLHVFGRNIVRDRKPNACDELAASPYDKTRLVKRGTDFRRLIEKPEKAALACWLALKKYPNDVQINFQAGRAYQAIGLRHSKIEKFKEAARYYQFSVDQGHPFAHVNLSHMYGVGIGMKRDYDLSIKLAKKAIELGGGPMANYALGNILVKQEKYAEAAAYLQVASKSGIPGSEQLLKKVYFHGFAINTIDGDHLRKYHHWARSNDDYAKILSIYYSKADPEKAARFGLTWFVRSRKHVRNKAYAADLIWSQDTKVEIQKFLTRSGLYSGPLDGSLKTNVSITALGKLVTSDAPLPELPIQ